MKKNLTFPTIAITYLLFLIFAIPSVQAATISLSQIKSGDLIRGSSFSSVYYFGEDGFRYVFPNDKTYFTWYKDFTTVKWISDSDMTKIQIGGNVTYRPGSKMIKINSDPRVYAVSQNGTLRSINSEEVAKILYGSTWNKMIDDVPDGFFGNYKIGSVIELASQYSPTSEKKISSINDDKNLREATIISITDDAYTTPTVHTKINRAVRWINTGTKNHSVTEWNQIWGSGTMKPSETFTHYFKGLTGTWSYYSIYDSKNSMSGAVVVE